ncbi:cysteinyl-tRNA synthetase [Rhizina undulata]
MTRHERQRTDSATSFHSLNSSRYGSEISMPAVSQGSRNPIQVPQRPRNRFEREQNVSLGSFPPASSPSSSNTAASMMNLSDHRRELSVLQTPPFILRQNPPSAGNSPALPNGASISAVTPTAGFLNSNIFDTQEVTSPLRPGTAPSSGSQGPIDSYFPDERRPSVASSTGSKSSIGKSIYKRIFGGDGDSDSPGSSESSLPSNTTPRTHYGFPRPTTPTNSRPRTPLPSSEVVPFLYQDPEDIRRLGDAPVHDSPVVDQQRYQGEEAPTSSSSHSHRIHLRRNKEKERDDEKSYNKELPPRPSSAGKDSFLNEHLRRAPRLNLDGNVSSYSSQTKLVRPGSPTPSIASSLSNNPPRSPGDNTQKKYSNSIWNKLEKLRKKEKSTDHDKEISPSTKSKRQREKMQEPLHVAVSGVPPIKPTPTRGTGNEYANPRPSDYALVEQQMRTRKQVSGKGGQETYGKAKGNRRGTPYEASDGKRGLGLGPNRLGRNKPVEEGTTFQLDTDFSNLGDIVKLPGLLVATPPDPNSSWLNSEETPPLGADITWEPPESWDSRNPKITPLHGAGDEGDDGGDAQYCIRIFRADSTFATLSCKLQSSVTEVLALLGRKSFLQGTLSNYQIVMKKNDLLRILGPNDKPLKIQKRLLQQAGYCEDDHIDELGREDHSYLCRFTFMMSRTGTYTLDQDPGLGKLQKFSHVDLQGRNLLTIPITLYHKSPEIISLNVSRNLSLNIPKDFIQQCVNLRKIEYQGNEAEKLPPSISVASRLTYLDISNNRLEELEHAQLENHASLVALKMSNNRLRSLPGSFSNFSSLRVLNISSNDLTVFPSFICELVTLVDLDISFNIIRGFPLEIGQLSALERLTATNNRLSGALPHTFSMLTSLKELDLRYNSLTNIDVVTKLSRLELVVAGHNAVSGFQISCAKLRALHLNSNPVTTFKPPEIMPTLKLLNLSNAKIAAIAETLFEKMPNLEKLLLDRNHIVSFPPQVGTLKKLEHLSCYSNEIASLPKEIGQLTELRYLDLHCNNLKTLPGEIWQLTSLMSLNLSSNILKEFPKPIVNPSTPSIIHENASTITLNKGEDVGKAGDPTGSRRPSQASIGLLSVGGSPGGGGRKGSLGTIQGPGGRKTPVQSKASSEGSTVMPPASFRKDSAASSRIQNSFAVSLKYLYLADNRLADEVFEEISLLSELRLLNISYNDLYDIPSRALSRMPYLSVLYLSGNELTSLPAEDLEHISNLKVLHLNGNKFMTLPAELGKVRKLLVLDVGSNSLKYNISNWPYDWNWNWNLDLKYLNLSGNKRLEIKPNRNDPNSTRERSITDFSQLLKLRVLGLMDVTLTISNVPDQTEDRRVRLSGSMVRHLAYGMADSLGKNEHLSLIDMVIPGFRGNQKEFIIGMFDGQALSTGGSKVSKYLQESIEYFLKEELVKLRPDERPGKALHRAFLNLNKELATVAMQTLDEKNVAGVNAHRGTITPSAMLGPDDLNTGSSATVVYMSGMNLYVANVGDAMALLVNTNGNYKQLTKKDDPAVSPELERIREAGGFVSRNGKLNDVLDVSRSFGYFNLMPCVNSAPHVTETVLSDQEEFLIIASKELWEYVSTQSAVDIARSERGDVMRAAHKLRDFAIAYGCTNKIMVMIIGFGDLKKALENRSRTQSMSVGPGAVPADESPDLFPVKLRRNPRRDIPDDSGLARLDAEVKAPEGDLAMVFTDIKNSTLLWETYPVAMRAAIKVHNTIMRRQLRIVGGYEIKTEGDAFMVCFPTATSALLWCFSVQALLLDAAWPQEIVESEQGKEILDLEGNVIYRGLSVRMGIHWGAPVCEPDPITRRMDYFGPMVNRASRISAVADGGQITVSSDFVTEMNRMLKAYDSAEAANMSPEDIFGEEVAAQAITREIRTLSSQGFELKELGERKLKGLENPEFIYLMYPPNLAGRESAARDAPKTEAKPSIDPEQIWALWDVSLKLEMLCSAVNTTDVPIRRTQSLEMAAKLKGLGEGASDQVILPLLEHIVTRIENCVANLYLRKLLAPDPSVGLFDSPTPIWDLIAGLETRLGTRIPQASIHSPARISPSPSNPSQ